MEFEKHVIRKAYKLYTNGVRIRQISQQIRKYYGIPMHSIKIPKLFGGKPHHNAYTKHQVRLMMYLYQNFYDTDKVILYLKERHNIITTKSGLVTMAHRIGISKKEFNYYWQSSVTRLQEKEMAEMYRNGCSSREIANRYGFKTRKSVADKVKKFNVLMRNPQMERKQTKTYLDFRFDLIDSKEKAYFLGLLLTDGYLDLQTKRLGIDLTDKDAIEFISSTFSIPFHEVKYKKKKHHLVKYRLVLYGQEHLEGIERLGLVERKSKILQPPKLKTEELLYISYILRGAIDGDGWIRKDGKEFFLVSASEDFIKWCMKMLILLGMNNLSYKFMNNSVYQIRSARQSNISILKEKIYNEPFGMMRKYNRLFNINQDPKICK